MENFAIIENGVVVNVVTADGTDEWHAPAGQTAVAIGNSGAWIGWSHDGTGFVAPPEIPDTAE